MSLAITCLERADILTLVSDDEFCFCHFPMSFPESVVSFNFIDS